ncbi:hypothetical protein O9929_08070 [Vibrio lentus]|nr:hypothetical protein [Vibrio lentus]
MFPTINGTIKHLLDGKRVVNIMADMEEGYNLALELPKIERSLVS